MNVEICYQYKNPVDLTAFQTPRFTEMSCDMGYIYGVVSCNVVFAFVMIKWVAQLNESSR